MRIRRFTAEKVGAQTGAYYFALSDIAERHSITNHVSYDRDGVLIVLELLDREPCGVEVVLQQSADYQALVRARAPSAFVDEMLDLIRTCSAALNTFKRITAEDGCAYMFKYALFDLWRALPAGQKCSRILSHEPADGRRIQGTWIRACPIGEDIAAIEVIVNVREELEADVRVHLSGLVPESDISIMLAVMCP